MDLMGEDMGGRGGGPGWGGGGNLFWLEHVVGAAYGPGMLGGLKSLWIKPAF